MNELPVVEDLAEIVAMAERCRPLFLRYSKGPRHDSERGNSHDYEADVALPGLSVTTVDPEDWWPRPAEDWVARRICKYDELGEEDGRYAWLLSGRIVGYGPDHEPLVADVRPLARVGEAALDEARRRYRERFDVGDDSRAAG